jgi:hypothetical protein
LDFMIGASPESPTSAVLTCKTSPNIARGVGNKRGGSKLSNSRAGVGI